MDLMLHAAEWLAWPDRPLCESPAKDDLAGALALATADLGMQATLVAPREVLWNEFIPSLAALPPQWAYLEADLPFTQWLAIASLAESVGALRLAMIVLHALEDLVRQAAAVPTATHNDEQRALMCEQISLCWTRRGRIARLSGQLDDAAYWYQQAQHAVRSAPLRDAAAQATLGLAALAANRGNYPAVVRQLAGLAREGTRLPGLYRMSTHQLMAIARRKQARYIDAMLHIWTAFDLLDATDFRREQLVGTMAEIALEAGDADAASHGFATVLRSTVGPFVRAPALLGAVRARIAQLHGVAADAPARVHARDPRASGARDAQLDSLANQMGEIAVEALAPPEAVLILLARAELDAFRGALDDAETFLESAEQLARTVGLHERLFTVEQVRTRLAQSAASHVESPTSDTPSPIPVARRTRHPALHRLLSLR